MAMDSQYGLADIKSNTDNPKDRPSQFASERPSQFSTEQGGLNPVGQFVEKYVRTPAQMLGATGGGIVGGGIGTVGGGGVASPWLATAGAIGGGGIGHAIMDEAVDKFQELFGGRKPSTLREKAGEVASETLEGVLSEVGGMTFFGGLGRLAQNPAVKAMLSRVPKLGRGAAKERAAQRFLALTQGKASIVDTIEEAKRLEATIPGFKVLGDDTVEKLNLTGAELKEYLTHVATENTEAVARYIREQQGTGAYDDIAGPLRNKLAGLEESITSAENTLGKRVGNLDTNFDPYTRASELMGKASELETAARTQANELFEAVPNVTGNAGSLADELEAIMKPMAKNEMPGDFPEVIKRTIKAVKDAPEVQAAPRSPNVPAWMTPRPAPRQAQPVEISLQDAQNMRSVLLDEIRTARSGEVRPRELRRLNQALGVFDNFIDNMASSDPQAMQQLAQARKFYKENVVEPFHTGATGRLLQLDRQGMPKIPLSKTFEQYFVRGPVGKENIMQFKRTFGNDPAATEALLDHIDNNLLTAIGDNMNPRRLKRWTQKHKYALDELGITNRYADIDNAQKALAEAQANKYSFDKSAANRFLNSDAQDAVRKALTTGGPKSKNIRDLLEQVGDDPSARAGVQNLVIENIMERAGTASDPLNISPERLAKLINREYGPVYKELFKGPAGKAKLDALYTVNDAISYALKKHPELGNMTSPYALRRAMLTDSFVQRLTESKWAGRAAFVIDALSSIAPDKATAYLNRARMDPEFALTLKRLAVEDPPREILDKFNAQLMNLRSMTPGQAASLKAEQAKRALQGAVGIQARELSTED